MLPTPARAQADSAAPQLLAREIASTHKMRINAYPYAYYTPETQYAVGAGGIITFYTAKAALIRPSKVTLSAYYASTGQYKVTLAPQLYLAGNRTVLTANADFGYVVDKYWGTGNNTPDVADSKYTAGLWSAKASLRLPFPFHLLPPSSLGLVYDFLAYDIRDTGNNPNITPETVGDDGGTSSGLGFSWALDTRDHVFVPRRGVYHQVEAVFNGGWLGSDFGYDRYEIDLRQYVPLDSRRVLAFQVYGNIVKGTTPFYDLPALGGARIMRGYYQGRYRDNALVAVQAEVRTPLFGRLGAVGFAGYGQVAPKLGDLRLGEFRPSLGGGLRFLFNRVEQVNLRVDIGFGRNTNGVYFGIEEAF